MVVAVVTPPATAAGPTGFASAGPTTGLTAAAVAGATAADLVTSFLCLAAVVATLRGIPSVGGSTWGGPAGVCVCVRLCVYIYVFVYVGG